MQPKFKSDKESQIAVSQASTPQLFSTLVRGSIERSELIDRILKLDIDPKIKLSFIQETGSQTSREFVEGMVSSIERDSGKIPGRSPWSQLAEFVNWESVEARLANWIPRNLANLLLLPWNHSLSGNLGSILSSPKGLHLSKLDTP